MERSRVGTLARLQESTVQGSARGVRETNTERRSNSQERIIETNTETLARKSKETGSPSSSVREKIRLCNPPERLHSRHANAS